ncbi:MAG: aldolase/citrate lyase family protein [Candidatus Krumholzibacteria bacterium]|nr:aldolase/citrate lyase family protein [Candidatus Krumholzibacteria bacterium]
MATPKTRKTRARRAAARPARRAVRRVAEAGRRGADVRSDLWVSVQTRAAGGVDVALDSKVAAFYGESIRRAATATLKDFGVRHARVRIEDAGALPFVVTARIEAALRRAGFERASRAPGGAAAARPTERDRLRRSRLYLPGNEPKFMVNAGVHRPDAVILDLEDSVHADEKDAARLLVKGALRAIDFMGVERMVRINQLPLGHEDIDAIVPECPDLILVPKAESAEQIREVDARIRRRQRGLRREHPVWLMPIVESALGVERAFEIARAADSVVALTIGLEDYTADLGVRKTAEGLESHFARARLVNAARAAGVQAIDSVFGDVGDLDGLLAWGRRSRAMGFEGMGCIHPRQIRVIHEAFAPSPEEIERALRIVAAFDEAKKKGLGVVSLGTRMIDPPVVLRAQRLVATARRAGLIEGS